MNNNYNIRNINKKDFLTIYNTIRESFWNLYRPGCEEHLIAYRIFGSKDYIPELSFVIEKDQQIIGCILYTKALVIDKNGVENHIVSFGPVCILPKFHRQGYGRKLIEHSIKTARQKGYIGIVIAGFRKHYECYGFVGAKKYQICLSDGRYYYGIMALPLKDKEFKCISGKVHFAECLCDPSEKEVENFDKDFAPKVKEVLSCQEDYLKEAAKLDV